MSFTHFPVRYAIVAGPKCFYVVMMVDGADKHFITVPDYDMGAFLAKAARNFPLFIIEDLMNANLMVGDLVPTRKLMLDMVIRQLVDIKANLYVAPYSKLPKYYENNYKTRGIAIEYHKGLWLCTFNVEFENLKSNYDNG